jgi:hypothetical protein
MRRVAAIVAASGLALMLPAVAMATWQEPVGGSHQVSDIGARPTLATIGSVPYVAWSEKHGSNNEVFVARLNAAGTSWDKLGGPVNFDTGHDAKDPGLTSVGGVPYVAWNENDGTNVEVRVARLNSAGHWEEPWKGVDAAHGGINEDAGKSAEDTTLTVVNGVPYVGWDEAAGSTFVPRVARLDTSTQPAPTWVEPWTGVSASSGGFQTSTTKQGSSPVVASINNTPYVAWTQSTNGLGVNHVRVARLEGSTWQQPWTGVSDTSGGISDPTHSTPLAYESRPSLASIGGYPYVAWIDSDGTNEDVRVARLDTSTSPAPTWTQEAAGVSSGDGRINQSSTEDALSLSLAAVAAGPFGVELPYIAWSEHFGPPNNGDYELRAARYNKASRTWEQPWPGVTSAFGAIGETATTNEQDPSLVVVGGVPFLARTAFGLTDRGIRVSRLEPEFSAQSAGPAPGGGEQFSLTARTYGIPYPLGFQYGQALESQTSTTPAPVGSETATITKQVGALRPNSTYEYRPFAIAGTSAPLAVGSTLAFQTNSSGTGVSSSGTGSNAVALATVLGEHLSRSRFPAAPSGPSARAAKRRSYGAVVTYNLDRAGSVTFTVTQRQAGRRGAHGRCVKPTKRNLRARRCTRTVTLHGSFVESGKAGANSFRFTGRLSRKRLKPGSYRLVATPTSGRLKGRPSSARFRIVK